MYKWSHSRRVIGEALVTQYEHLARSGWPISKDVIQQSVQRILGGSYEEFMAKDVSLVPGTVEVV